MTKHTPTPWALFSLNGVVAIRNPRARSSHSEIVFWSGFDASHYPKQAEANAAFIVKAVNNHDALVKALRKLDSLLDFSDEKLESVWTFDDTTSIQAAFAEAKAALDGCSDPVGQTRGQS